jgi:hypothetical protein
MLVAPATSLAAPSVTGEFALPTFNDGMAEVPTTVRQLGALTSAAIRRG